MYVFVNCKCGVEAAEEVSMHSQWWGSSRSGFWSGQWMIKQAFAQHMRCSRSPTCICLLPQLFFWVLHLNLCTWNLRLCDPAGWCWVRSCAHRNWICVAFYSGRATFPQCCQSPHLRLGINNPLHVWRKERMWRLLDHYNAVAVLSLSHDATKDCTDIHQRKSRRSSELKCMDTIQQTREKTKQNK